MLIDNYTQDHLDELLVRAYYGDEAAAVEIATIDADLDAHLDGVVAPEPREDFGFFGEDGLWD